MRLQCITYHSEEDERDKKYFNDNNSGSGINHDPEMLDKSGMRIKLNCTKTYI